MDPKKFDPQHGHVLDAQEREHYLPTTTVVDLLELSGSEIVLDYGAGTGRIARAAGQRLASSGRVLAVDESAEMLARLEQGVAESANAEALLIADNHVPLADGSVDRILAIA